jgi:hypothetical protein
VEPVDLKIRRLCPASWHYAAFLGFVICCVFGSAFGQMTTGTILGRVTDPSGGAIPGARVTVTDTGTGLSHTFVTGSDGSYVVPYLIPGTYSVSAQKQGFRTLSKTGITLEVNQKARIDLTLQVGSLTQRVTVSTQAPLLQTQSSEQGTVIAGAKIVSMPLNLREFAELVNLTTGTTPNAVGGDLGSSFSGDNPQAIDSSSVNGIESDADNWTIDGISDNEAFFSVLTVNPSVDAIQEFNVDNNNYSAEFGRAGGANVQIAIKSGANQFHGDAFEFFRNSGLEANNFFSNQSGAAIPPYRQNQFGANIGGPIRKDRTFFFVDYEGLRTRLGESGLSTIPTTAERTGDFSASGSPIIYNAFNVNAATGQPQPFAGNIIPSSMINPAAAKVMALFPNPNVVAPLGQPNFYGVVSEAHNIDEGDVRIDHRLTDKDQLMGRYSLLRTTLLNPAYLGTVIGGGPGDITAYTRNQNAVISETHTFSPTTLNEFRVGVNRVNTNWYGLDENLQTSNQVGIPGINNFCGTCGGLPTINIAGFTSFGHASFAPTLRHDTTFEYVDNVTFIRGKHTIKVGADIQRIQADLYQTTNPIGEFCFNQENTSQHGATGTGSGLAGFLLGYPDFAGRAALTDFPSNRDTQTFFFGQDDFRAMQNLTLNLGLRWEYYGPSTDAWNNQANFNLTTGNIQVACVAISCSGGIQPDYHNWEPRVGFAYSMGHNSKTVLRGGFGISRFYPGYGGANFGTLDDNFPYVQGQGFAPANFFTVTPGDPVLSNGLPALPPPQERPGAPPGNLIPTGGATAGAFSSVFYMPADLPMSAVYQWSLDLQRELSPNLMLSVAYVGNRANYLALTSLPGNYPEPGVVTSTGLSLQEARPYYSIDPGLAGFTKRIQGGNSIYNSLQVKLQKRTSYGLSFLASYTWEHDLGRGQNWVNPDLYMAQESNIGGVPPQTFVLSYTYQLPFGQGEHFGAGWNKWTNAVLGDWQLSGITSYFTGLPFNPTVTSTLDNGNGDMPNRICNGALPGPTIQEWFNTSCFTTPGLNQFGNSGFNMLYGPGFADWDMALMKNVHVSESKYFQFRAEFYNAFNGVNFGEPSTLVCTACGEGTITSLASTYNPRLVQFGLKLYY